MWWENNYKKLRLNKNLIFLKLFKENSNLVHKFDINIKINFYNVYYQKKIQIILCLTHNLKLSTVF